MIIIAATLSIGENEVIVKGDSGEFFKISIADAKRVGVYRLVENEALLPEEFDEEILDFMSRKLSCVKYGAYLLEFGDKSKKTLASKMQIKGYDKEICLAALDVLEKSGIIDDDRLCLNKLKALATEKLYGPYRLKAELLKKGFTSKQIEIAMDEAELDYDESISRLVDKFVSRGFCTDRKSIDSLKNKLSRYGYSYESISYALQNITDEYSDVYEE